MIPHRAASSGDYNSQRGRHLKASGVDSQCLFPGSGIQGHILQNALTVLAGAYNVIYIFSHAHMKYLLIITRSHARPLTRIITNTLRRVAPAQGIVLCVGLMPGHILQGALGIPHSQIQCILLGIGKAQTVDVGRYLIPLGTAHGLTVSA